ncbi:hypothetical protein VFPPC_17434 [Pochonia chlamydosporia 170]|uniref:Uncharacterized protein n=1 Tax=Pochonia chlamydosporia 170 TaxID=1380566 RepID=A0A219ARL0_METCM|nr:hypothetical protein VFPPC_17434 [Pochonia chlamydosporia 170]OWT43417.1 hypothetical protein VFPPC_17434 [Pochonia chlamydosporia 170]
MQKVDAAQAGTSPPLGRNICDRLLVESFLHSALVSTKSATRCRWGLVIGMVWSGLRGQTSETAKNEAKAT